MFLKSITFLLLIALCQSTFAQRLRIAMLANSETQNIGMCVLREAYKNIGVEVIFHAFPATRSLKQSNSGEYDGETSRILAASKTYKNLIPIIIPTLSMRSVAFTIKHTDFKPGGWASLAPYRVIILKAVIAYEMGTKNLPNVIKATNYDAPFKMLNLDRGDVVIGSYLDSLIRLRDPNLSKIVALNPPIMEDPLHHFLNKKHAKLVPVIEAEMQRLQHSGRIDQIYQEYVKQLTDIQIAPNNGDAPTVPCPV